MSISLGKVRYPDLLLFILLSFIFYLGVQSALSQIYAVPVKNSLEYLRLGGDSRSLTSSEAELYAYMSQAVEREPENAAFWELSGDIRAYDLDRGFITTDPAQRRQRVTDYEQAIQHKPAKAEYWVKLAYAKAQKKEFDQAFYRIFETAHAYARSESYIQRALMRMSLAYWYSMSVDSRVLLRDIVVALYQTEPHQTLLLAKEYGQLRMACIWVKDEGETNPWCVKEFSKMPKAYKILKRRKRK